MSQTAITSRPVVQGLSSPLASLASWRARRRSRLALAKLDARLLHDIGVSKSQALREVEKPFWSL